MKLSIKKNVQAIIISLVLYGLGFLSGYGLIKKTPVKYDDLSEWMDGSGYTRCIKIDDNVYYGDDIENIAGNDKFIVYRTCGYLILPDKIIVKELK